MELTAFTNLSLDGVFQAPGRVDEDTRGEFAHGGWAAPYQAMYETGDLNAEVELLFGRWTFEQFHHSWSGDDPFSQFFRATRKHVVTRQKNYRTDWANSTVLEGEAAASVAKCKAEASKPLLMFGSGILASELMAHGLIDRYVLLIHPLFLGSGRPFAAGLPAPHKLTLQEVRSTKKGVLIATYTREN